MSPGNASMSNLLLTGFPSNELACRVLDGLLQAEPNSRVTCLVPPKFHEAAHAWLEGREARVEILEGDVAAIDMGLSGPEFRELAARVQVIHHCAAVTYSGAPRTMAERVNVGGTHEVIELGQAAKHLERVVHWSTLSATGPNQDVLREASLLPPRSSRLMETRYRAEKLMLRARKELPITVLRPALLVGDRIQGSLRRIEGLHLLIASLLSLPLELPLPIIGAADSPFHAIPIDFAVEAGLTLAQAREAVGRTFHIVEAAPPTLREVFDGLCSLLDRPPAALALPNAFTRMLLNMPGLERAMHAQRSIVEETGRGAGADDREAHPILARAGLQCPSLLAHLPMLVEYVSARRGQAGPRFAFPSLAGR